MPGVVQCTQCKYESPLGGQYCSQCGAPLLQECKFCGEDNVMDAKYCRKCGIEWGKIEPGILMGRAAAWKQQFSAIGWRFSVTEDLKWLIEQMQEQDHLPKFANRTEEYIFICQLTNQVWNPIQVNVKSGTFSASVMGSAPFYIIATRCRLAFLNTRDKAATIVWYKDIESYTCGGSQFGINSKQGEKIDVTLRLGGPGMLDVVVALTGTDVLTKSNAQTNVQQAHEVKREFMSLICEFVKEIASVTEVRDLRSY